ADSGLISSGKVGPQALSPPVPSPLGSPPWIMNPLTMRWNVRPSYSPCSASSRKFSTAFGESAARNSIVIGPLSVSMTPCMPPELLAPGGTLGLAGGELQAAFHRSGMVATIPAQINRKPRSGRHRMGTHED